MDLDQSVVVFDRQHPLAEVLRKAAAHNFMEELMQSRTVRNDRVARRKVLFTRSVCLFCFVLFCIVLFCFVLFCFVLFCFVLFCFVLFCFVLFCFVCLFVF